MLSSAERRALIESPDCHAAKESHQIPIGRLWRNGTGDIREFDQLVGMTLDAIATNLSMEDQAPQVVLVALVDKHKAETPRVSTDRRRTLDPAWQMAERAAEMVRTGGAD